MANVPPKYDDLGKESRDVFGKGYGKLVEPQFNERYSSAWIKLQ